MKSIEDLLTKTSLKYKIAIKSHYVIVQLCKLISFNCDFRDGECRHARKEEVKVMCHPVYIAGCCCSNCVRRLGYLKFIPEYDIEAYKRCWDDETGFYEPKIGCRLPKQLKSKTCIWFYCDTLVSKMSKKDKLILKIISKLWGR